MKRLVVIVSVVLCLSGCVSGMRTGEGYIEIHADARGMDALSRHNSGLITNGKASGDAEDTPAWVSDRHAESERTERYVSPGLLDGLFVSAHKAKAPKSRAASAYQEK